MLTTDALFRTERFTEFDLATFTPERVLVEDYYNYSDEPCLTIELVMPDKTLPPKDRDQVVAFMQAKGKPMEEAINQLPMMKQAKQIYRIIEVYFLEKSDLIPLEDEQIS